MLLIVYYDNILFKKEKKNRKKNKIHIVSNFGFLPPAGFEPMTLEFSTYLPNVPDQLRYRLILYSE